MESEVNFEGTLAELIEWAQATFVNPNSLRVSARMHTTLEEPVALKNSLALAILLMQAKYSRKISSNQMLHVIDCLKKDKILGIRAVKEATNLSFKEAKDFVASNEVHSLLWWSLFENRKA